MHLVLGTYRMPPFKAQQIRFNVIRLDIDDRDFVFLTRREESINIHTRALTRRATGQLAGLEQQQCAVQLELLRQRDAILLWRQAVR